MVLVKSSFWTGDRFHAAGNSGGKRVYGILTDGQGIRGKTVIENYIKATELNYYNSSAYHGLGFAYVQLGRLEDALAAYTKFVELSPKNPEACRNRGNVYGYKGDFISAGADFRKACSLGSRESCNYLQDPRFR